jgi:hypothetical protein
MFSIRDIVEAYTERYLLQYTVLDPHSLYANPDLAFLIKRKIFTQKSEISNLILRATCFPS